MSLPVALAHLWVRRIAIFWTAWASLAAVAMAWWLFLSPSAPLSPQGRNHRQVENLAAAVDRTGRDVRALAADKSVAPEVDRLAAEAEVYRKREDAEGLETVRKNLADLEKRLGEAYTVGVVSGANRKSAVDRYFRDKQGKRVSGFYLIVEAKAKDGTALTRRIHDDEKDKDQDVTTWAERVPEAVYERLKKDKLHDGILNETAFAVKRKGAPEEEITMPGPDGKPLARLGRITEW